jgi:hypothetical protein
MVLLHLNHLHHFTARPFAMGLPLKQEVGYDEKGVHVTPKRARACARLGVVLASNTQG